MSKWHFMILLIQQVLSIDERSPTLSEHPLFAHIFRLLDQLLVQVRRTRMLLCRTYDAIDQIPTNVRPMYSECIAERHNVTRLQYVLRLSEAEVMHIPRIETELKQAVSMEQQWTVLNRTDRVVADITLNVVQPCLSLLTELLDCLLTKSHFTVQ